MKPEPCDSYEPGHWCEQCEAWFEAQMAEFERMYGAQIRSELANERWERENYGRVLTDEERMRDAGRIP